MYLKHNNKLSFQIIVVSDCSCARDEREWSRPTAFALERGETALAIASACKRRASGVGGVKPTPIAPSERTSCPGGVKRNPESIPFSAATERLDA